MALTQWWSRTNPVAGGPGVGTLTVDASAWCVLAHEIAVSGGTLLALWTTPPDASMTTSSVRAAYLVDDGLLIASLPWRDEAAPYPGLEGLFPSAARMQRAAFDLTGIRADAADQRPWLRHAAWPAERHPLRAPPPMPTAQSIDDYAFVPVDGEGVHEIPVGPVHAGIIEPGHFRFSVVGEKVLRLEERLGYTHKGIEHRFTTLTLFEAQRLAARICGDSTVAYSWAYCQALEGLVGVALPPRALYLRALALELERLHNHLGDLGALGNDAGFAFALVQFSRLKEQLLRVVERALGQRYLFDWIVPGGTARDLEPAGSRELVDAIGGLAHEVRELRQIYLQHPGLRDRFTGTGRVDPATATRLGLCGLAGRASGRAHDLRVNHPWPPYDRLEVPLCLRRDGDVAARVDIRFDEVETTCALVTDILHDIPTGPVQTDLPQPRGAGFAVGLIEGWRGPVMLAVEINADQTIRRCHAHDPSWQNWPVLEHAIIDNIAPDFPLINKSFNLSYSGHDL